MKPCNMLATVVTKVFHAVGTLTYNGIAIAEHMSATTVGSSQAQRGNLLFLHRVALEMSRMNHCMVLPCTSDRKSASSKLPGLGVE